MYVYNLNAAENQHLLDSGYLYLILKYLLTSSI